MYANFLWPIYILFGVLNNNFFAINNIPWGDYTWQIAAKICELDITKKFFWFWQFSSHRDSFSFSLLHNLCYVSHHVGDEGSTSDLKVFIWLLLMIMVKNLIETLSMSIWALCCRKGGNSKKIFFFELILEHI